MRQSAFYEAREIPFPTKDPGPSLMRFSQYQVRDRVKKFVIGVYESEPEANLIAAKKNYLLALRDYSDWAQARSEGYDLDIERDRVNRLEKRDAYQVVAKRALDENLRVEDFDHRAKTPGRFRLKP